MSNVLKPIVSYILTRWKVNIVLAIPSQNLLLFYSEFLIISDFSALSTGPETEEVIDHNGKRRRWSLEESMCRFLYALSLPLIIHSCPPLGTKR